MLAEVLTCDACRRTLRNVRYFAIEVGKIAPLQRGSRRRGRGHRWDYRDLCVRCFGKLVRLAPYLKPRSRR